MADWKIPKTIERQCLSEAAKLGELCVRLELLVSPEKLLEFSGLSIGTYKVRRDGRIYHCAWLEEVEMEKTFFPLAGKRFSLSIGMT